MYWCVCVCVCECVCVSGVLGVCSVVISVQCVLQCGGVCVVISVQCVLQCGNGVW
ncbi:MAG: hypothetical protein ACRC4N_00005 [Gammaproteobacteria bacterium]